MQGHETGCDREGPPRNGLDIMITQTGTRPQFLHCNDVVVTLGVGGSHLDLVDDLRRTAWRRYLEERSHGLSSWLRSWS